MKAEFSIQDMLPIGITLVVLGIALAYGLNVMEDVKVDMCDSYNSATGVCSDGSNKAYNATVDAIAGVAKLPEKLPLIVTVIVAAIIIGIIVRYLFVRYSGGGA